MVSANGGTVGLERVSFSNGLNGVIVKLVPYIRVFLTHDLCMCLHDSCWCILPAFGGRLRERAVSWLVLFCLQLVLFGKLAQVGQNPVLFLRWSRDLCNIVEISRDCGRL